MLLGSAKTVPSRFAEPSSSSRFAPAGSVDAADACRLRRPRFQANTGVTSRSISSTAVGISSGSPHSSAQRAALREQLLQAARQQRRRRLVPGEQLRVDQAGDLLAW